MVYLDSSALSKLYVVEEGSDDIRNLVKTASNSLFTSIVTHAEVLSALARAAREERITGHEHTRHRRSFLRHWELLNVVSLNREVLRPADTLIRRHGLRAYDAIQLCSALWTGRPRFACFDQRLRAAAEAEGLAVVPHK